MPAQYIGGAESRRAAVRLPHDANGAPLPPTINGLDYLEVAEDDQRTLLVRFIHPLPGQADPVPGPPAPPLTAANLHIEGGTRVQGIAVTAVVAAGNLLTVGVSEPGDFSTYTLRLVTAPGDPGPPPGFDPQLTEVAFSFKVACPTDFDCVDAPAPAPTPATEPPIDYLAKDYASFRRLMLDRLTAIMPDWQERNPADLGLTLVELLAYAADHLSYYQDAVATEAYLGTARQRPSAARHARLLDYPMHEGCNARAWVAVQYDPGDGSTSGVWLPGPARDGSQPGTRLLTETGSVAPDLATALSAGALVFETLHDLYLRSAHNTLRFYTWSAEECRLPQGATRATLRDNAANRLALRPGDVLLFEEQRSPLTGRTVDADPAQRHAVRLTSVTPAAQRVVSNGQAAWVPAPPITDPLTGQPIVEIAWEAADALPFALTLATVAGGEAWDDVTVARGNIVLADHGLTVPDEPLPLLPLGGRPYRPQLERVDLTWRVPYSDTAARHVPAADTRNQDPQAALPAVSLRGPAQRWAAVRDLLNSDRFAAEFVVEMANDGRAALRFGDGLAGRRPAGRLTATYRIGNGRAGNVGAEAISGILGGPAGIQRVRNPLPATGGTAPETLEQVRLYAPQAFRSQERAVTAEDYAALSGRHPDVQRAAATVRWTGSWYTVFISVDRRGGRPVDAAFQATLRQAMEPFRMAGYDLEIAGPRFVALDLALRVCVAAGHFRSAVAAALRTAFSASSGFFQPDNFTFGQAVYLSQVLTAAMQVPGVAWVEPVRFDRWGQASSTALATGILPLDRLEIARLDNDPSAVENGQLELLMEGGI